MSRVISAYGIGELHSLRKGTFSLETTSFEQEIPMSVSSFVFIEVVLFTISSPENGLIFYFM